MKKILIIAISIICCSCSNVVMNQGFKSYKSEVAKTEEYKKANGFQQDLLYLNDLCENSFPEIDTVFPHQLRESIVDSLINLLSDSEINKQIFRGYALYYLSHFDNQHTEINGTAYKGFYPYLLKSTGEDWYLWDINKEYDSLLIGKQVVKINNESIDQFEKKLFHYVCAENDICKRTKLFYILNRPSLLKQYDLIEQTDSILLSFENGERAWIKSIYEEKDLHFHLGGKRYKPNAVTEYLDNNYNVTFYPDENFAYLQYNRCFDKIDAFDTMSDYVKPWIMPFAKLYLKRLIKKKKDLKNDVGFKLDYDRIVFKDYLNLMFDSLQTQNLDNLVIDLRNNGGGSHLLCLQLLYYLTDREDLKGFSVKYHMSDFNRQICKSDFNKFVESYRIENDIDPEYGKLYPYGYDYDSLLFEKIEDPKSVYYIPKDRKLFKGKIIVLANYGTGSAAALLTALMQDNNIATVIGTSVGNNPIGATTYSPFKLPNSKLTGTVASDYFVRPNPKNGKIFIPDYWIENNVEDIINGKDKYLEKAIELINSN